MKLATKTLEAINRAIERDQGATYRYYLGQVLPQIKDAYDPDTFPFRTHLGASLIGRECTRELWYSFRWSKRPSFRASMLMLFNRGHLEEGRFVAMLLAAGMQVYQSDAKNKQLRISDCGGHFGGSLDSIITGSPDIPEGESALGEFKTHNEKSFKKLTEEGVQKAKPEHYIQMQIYMAKMCLKWGLYFAVNKNNDELYIEIIELDNRYFYQYRQRAEDIIISQKAPKRVSEKPAYWKCKYCDYNKICHYNERPEQNCRTCKHSGTCGNGNWYCGLHSVSLTKETQLIGCQDFERLF